MTKEPFRERNIINPAPHSQFQSPHKNHFVSPSKSVFEPKVERKGLGVVGNKNLYESQTDKRSVQSN